MVQGAAEVYPVSSSAQLTLLPRLLRWDPPEDRTRFAAGLHAGSALGLALAVRPDALEVRRAVAASVPAAVAGLLLHDTVERRLGTTRGIAAGLVLGAAALWWADRRTPTAATTPSPLVDGGGASTGKVVSRGVAAAALAQVVALAPGVSRHGATLTTLRAEGVERDLAMRTSLLMSLPLGLGAAGLTAVRGRQAPRALPTALAATTAYVAARHAKASRTVVAGSVLYRLALAAAAVARLRKDPT